MKGEENSNQLISNMVSPSMYVRAIIECSLWVTFIQLISRWKTCSRPLQMSPISGPPESPGSVCLTSVGMIQDPLQCSVVLFQSMGNKILMDLTPRSRNRILPHPRNPLVLLLNHLFLCQKVLIHYRQGKRCDHTLGFIIQGEESGNSSQG